VEILRLEKHSNSPFILAESYARLCLKMTQIDITKLKSGISGRVIIPGDRAYDEARVTFTVKDAHPAVIVQAASTQDISAAIEFSQCNHFSISIRSGKHSVAGFSTNNDGVVIDLSPLHSIEILDEKTGLVRLGSGAHWGDVAAKLDEHKLAISSGDTKSVAVGGLTLGGGIGWMVRKYGYAIDSLVGAEVVLADGSVVRASESENSDLFWALRGGGGNFGVVSSFDFKAHRQGKIIESILVYGIDDLAGTITGWRDYMRTAPEDITSFMTLLPGFGGSAPKAMITSCYAHDDTAAAKTAIDPLRHLGELVSDDTIVKNYADMLQEAHPPQGVKFVVKNLFAKTFSDELVSDLSTVCGKTGSPIVQLRMVNGAPGRVSPDSTALAHRDSEIFLFAGLPIPPGATKEQEAQSLKPWAKLAAHSSGAYSNFLSTNTPEDVASIYPPDTYERLAGIKRTYDPENIFSHNFNIKPA
jgi:FAD/FMN-containing dehydrogenase